MSLEHLMNPESKQCQYAYGQNFTSFSSANPESKQCQFAYSQNFTSFSSAEQIMPQSACVLLPQMPDKQLYSPIHLTSQEKTLVMQRKQKGWTAELMR